MSENTRILSLPLIQGGQAQKHITHNEALRRLDALVQPVALDLDLTEPPLLPDEGDRHIVATGATGDWAGRDGTLAVREGDGWTFISPAPGWQIHVIALGSTVTFDGVAWRTAQIRTLGINATADDTNRLSVAADATLLTHDGGGHQVKINKADPGDTGSLLFQTGFSGRAEMGCAGTDGFSVKVSADGSTWNTALTTDPATGVVSFPSGTRVSNRVPVGGRWSCFPDTRWVTFNSETGPAGGTHASGGGVGMEPAKAWKAVGPFVSAGTTVTGLGGLMRASNANIVGCDIRVYFQAGPAGGGWSTDTATTRTLLLAADAVALGTFWTALDEPFAPFDVPQDGFLTVHVKPRGTFTTTGHIASALTLDLMG
ncbi:DUF2793 domain-containing protein [Jannaschia donghaensis]|uniref:DUF2793 domain-containing protein n=1 Tax=Jannaschia donghaensis TaxID=420998 RepID=A0A0M6YHS0_9RHOB|nr:DUF2793 domain-containing protein [Jannaschia donghaensis]CTQ49329.1 hypothetical protein JDO7802_01342 [Jannaschia donghaensis]